MACEWPAYLTQEKKHLVFRLSGSRPLVSLGAALALALAIATPAAASTPKLKAPGAPSAVTVVAADTALSVSWVAPTVTGGAAITGYTATATSKGLTTERCSTSGATTCLLTGIVNPAGKAKNQYAVSVQAINSVGAGKAGKATGKFAATTNTNCAYVGPDANLSGCNLSGADLVGVNFNGANLSYANLIGADLSGADLSQGPSGGYNTDLLGINLTNANLTGASVAGQNFPGLAGALLVGADLTDVNLTASGTNLTGMDLTGAILTGDSLASSQGANFTNATLTDTSVNGVNLSGATLTGVLSGNVSGTPAALPTGWQLIGGYFVGQGANLTGADLGGLDLAGATLTAVISSDVSTSVTVCESYTPAQLLAAYSADLSFLEPDGRAYPCSGALRSFGFVSPTVLNACSEVVCTFSGPESIAPTLPTNYALDGGFLVGPGVNLTGANLSGLDFSNVDLALADFTNASLTNANLTSTDVDGANFTNANLTGATLLGNALNGTVWANTTCPDGTVTSVSCGGLPGAATNVQVTCPPVGTTCTVTFTPAPGNGTAVTSYDLTGGLTGEPDFLNLGTIPAGQSSYSLTVPSIGLGRSVQIALVAVNNFGTGPDAISNSFEVIP